MRRDPVSGRLVFEEGDVERIRNQQAAALEAGPRCQTCHHTFADHRLEDGHCARLGCDCTRFVDPGLALAMRRPASKRKGKRR